MFARKSVTGYREVLPGITRKTLVHGDHTLMAEFRLRTGAVLPPHSHLHEQTGYLVSGHMILRIGGREEEVRPGDSWNIPAHVEHGATIRADSVAIEIFHPVRKDYLPD